MFLFHLESNLEAVTITQEQRTVGNQLGFRRFSQIARHEGDAQLASNGFVDSSNDFFKLLDAERSILEFLREDLEAIFDGLFVGPCRLSAWELLLR